MAAADPATRVTYAPVREADFDELVDLRIAAMRASLERLGRFDPERARDRLRQSFFPEHSRIIVCDGRRIGFYTLRPVENALHLVHLYVHPGHQGQGIGSLVLRKLLAEADAAGMPVQLGALKGSDSNRFYRRHGFNVTREDEWDTYYVRPPAAGAKRP